MAYTLEIKFSGGSWQDITSYVLLDSLKIERTMHNKLVSVVNKASFVIKEANFINSINSATEDILIQIKDGANYLFSGVLSQEANTTIKSFVEGQEVTALDYLYFLDKKLNTNIIGTNYYIKKDTDTANSIFHLLLAAAGLTSYVSGNILTQISVFKAVKGESIIEILDKILFEYGYCLYANESGAIGVKQLLKSSWTSAGTISNNEMYGELGINKNDPECEAAEIEWDELTYKSSIILAEDTTNGDNTHRCNITVAAGSEYPEDSDTIDTYINYESTLGEVYAATSASLSITKTANLTTQTFTNYFTKAQICIKNSSGTNGAITKLQITGNAYIKKTQNYSSRYIVSGTTKIYNYKANYIFDKTNAQTLADWLAQYFYNSRLKYSFTSKTSYNLGECYTLTESTLSINTKVLIIKKTYNFKTGFYDFEAEGITEYTAGTVVTETNITTPATEIIVADTATIIDQTLTQLTQNDGTSLGGYTTTPTTPTWGTCTVQNWLINLVWDKQWNLSNLDYYELQVSQDQVNWYDFDGNINQYTIAYQESAVFKGGFTDDDPPLGIGYYFRARRKTKAGEVSNWSTLLLATTVPIGKDGTATNGLIWLDANNFWDFINSKFKIGTSTRYIYFDGTNIYFQSVDIELTTADLITYNSGKTKRLIHTSLSLKAQGGTSWGTTYGGVWYDETNSVMVVQADEIYQGSSKVIYQNSNSEIEIDTNKLVANKELVVGADGQSGNWITNITPVLRQRDTTNTENYYMIINTKIIAPNGGSYTMFDVILKTYALGYDLSKWYNNQQMQVRFTGYLYYTSGTYTIYKFRAHIIGSNHYNIYAGAYIDNTNGYLHLFLYSPDKYFSQYYRYSEVFLNNYYQAKKSYVDGWSISYADSISGYDTNFGIMYAKTGGEVYSQGSAFTLATASLSGASTYTRYFEINRDIVGYLESSAGYGTGSFLLYGSVYLGHTTTGNYIRSPQMLKKGKHKVLLNFSSTTSTTLTLKAFIIDNYAPYSMWSGTDICPRGFTTS